MLRGRDIRGQHVLVCSCASRTHIDDVWEAWTDGYMARTANLVAVCETTCKKATQSESIHGNGDSGIDRPVPNDPFLLHSQLSAEDVSFSEPFHQGADIGLRVQGRVCVGRRPQVVVGVGDTA